MQLSRRLSNFDPVKMSSGPRKIYIREFIPDSNVGIELVEQILSSWIIQNICTQIYIDLERTYPAIATCIWEGSSESWMIMKVASHFGEADKAVRNG